ncbi:MAG: MaoC family dehydratase [Pseudomonadota bacterium]
MADRPTLEQLAVRAGQLLGTSRWFAIPQDRIDAFGRITDDVDEMHMSPDWAAEHGPYGGTIAYGFLTLSMLTAMANDVLPRLSGEAYKLNYGFDRVRLMAPVPAGARIRGHMTLGALKDRKPGQHLMTVRVEVEVEGGGKPALVADWLFLIVMGTAPRDAVDAA